MEDKRSRFEAQVMPHLDAAYRFARWLTRPGHEAEDVVQEALLRAYRAFDTLRGPDVKGWLLAIVRNCHTTALRQQQRRGFVPLPEQEEADFGATTLAVPAPDPEGHSIAEQQRHRLTTLLGELGAEHREVLVLREMEDLSYREIAAVTQLPIGTVMSRLARARAALKASWLKHESGEPRAVR